ncbi:MAG: hypothetical protein M3Q68_06870 [Actinomycetota bacterium]|nr:hypothetical protein [Actinomycetota bacterium]
MPAVKAALVALLTTAINDATVQVVWGRPQDSLVSRQCVYIADVSYASEIANIKSGRKQRDERYTVDVVISIYLPRGESQTCEERAYALLDSLENVLADDPTLGGVDGLGWAVLGNVSVATVQLKEGPNCVIVADVDVLARLV